MKRSLGRAGLIFSVLFSSMALSGCFDLMSETVEESANGGTDPGPGTGDNAAPVISGNPPAAVTVGGNYLFTPNASDADNDSLTFEIQNKPDWVNFDPSTGTISGVALLGTEGTYSDIQLSVSDGTVTVALPIFSVEVTQIALGTITLSWTAPTLNNDGTPLLDLSGYKIYYGTEQGFYSNQIHIENPGLTAFVVDNLLPATYFFVSTSINSAGVESQFSNIATVVVAND